MLLNPNKDANVKIENYGTAPIAAVGGSAKVVERLPNQKADVNAKYRLYGNALIKASAGG